MQLDVPAESQQELASALTDLQQVEAIRSVRKVELGKL